MSKMQTAVTENGIQFLVTRANGKVEALPGDFAFVEPMSVDKAFDALKHEVGQRGNVTRAALTALYTILQHPRMDGYKGVGNINDPEGAKIVKEAKTAIRAAEEAYFAPMFKDSKKLDSFLTGIRDAGIYATVKGVALKYFYFLGKLPCLYVNDSPEAGKLLSVSAMQKLLANAMDEKPAEDKSLASRVLGLEAEAADKTDWTRAELVVLLSNLKGFAQSVQEAINSMDAHATDNTAVMAPKMSEEEMIAAVNAAWDSEPAEQEEEALF